MKKMHKPCPFCGHKKSRITQYDGDIWRSCCGCHASTRACQTVRDATEFWNIRPAKGVKRAK